MCSNKRGVKKWINEDATLPLRGRIASLQAQRSPVKSLGKLTVKIELEFIEN